VRSRLTIVPVLALLGGLSAWAQAPQKFAIINMQEALVSTKDGQKAVTALKAKFAPKEQEFQKRQADLQAKQDELRRTENTISEEKKAALARDIDSMTKSLQRDTDDAREDVNQEQQKVLNDLGAKVMAVLNKYSVDKGLTMVFDISGQPNNVMFATNSIDITRDIISLYDASPQPTPASSSAAPPRAPASAPKAPATAPSGAAKAPAAAPAPK
jgi:outer membrane protein